MWIECRLESNAHFLGRVLFHVKWTVLHDKPKFSNNWSAQNVTEKAGSGEYGIFMIVLLSEIKDSGYDGNLGLKTEVSHFCLFTCIDHGILHTWVIIVCSCVSSYLFRGYYTTQFRKLGRMCVVPGVLPNSFRIRMRCLNRDWMFLLQRWGNVPYPYFAIYKEGEKWFVYVNCLKTIY